jgi:dihydrofolate synthase/folylpolyglutamate synthase
LTPPLPADLQGWLDYIERLHPATIELGLERVREVYARLDTPKFCPLFIVGGTNGKGSTCTLIEAMLKAAGFRVGKYLSPHILHFNERVHIGGRSASDEELIAGFRAVEAVRGNTQLTYFEFTTLAAWFAFSRAGLGALVLEVGLGGRLDAVNIFEPDCSVLTSVALDHMDYLGDTREKIGWEKAHIFRSGKPAICSEIDPPQSVINHAAEIGTQLQLIGRDFGYEGNAQQWLFWSTAGRRSGLPHPALRGANQLQNAAAAIAALESVRELLPVGGQAVREGLVKAHLPGRFQVLPGRPSVILDVGHNPHAAAVLRENLSRMGAYAHTRAVVGMLADKDVGGVFELLRGKIDHWYLADLNNPRGATAQYLNDAIETAQAGGTVQMFAAPRAAYAQAMAEAAENDRILVFGSFYTVADVMQLRGLSADA